MARSLTAWLEDPHPERGLSFAEDRDGWDHHTYADLARAIGGAAAQIEHARSERGRPVAIVLPTGADFVTALFGAIIAGDTACQLPPPGPTNSGEYAQHLGGILATAQPSLVVTNERLESVVRAAMQHGGVDAPVLQMQREDADPTPRPPAPFALLQFTSGSSGRPRGVRITPENLNANIAMIARWLECSADEFGVSWLPLFHDMGLIGALLMPVAVGGSMYLMRPSQFVRRPARWLECIARLGARYTAAPPFGFRMTRRRVSDDDIEGWDFSNWRVAAVGAERLDAPELAAFAEWLAPHGFRPETFRPAYGLAENTLAVTGAPPRAIAPVVRIDPGTLFPGQPVEVLERASLAEPGLLGHGAGWLVGSGRAHPEVGLEIREGGRRLPDGCLGEIHVSGPSVADGYEGDEPTRSTRFDADGLSTGDAGFVVDGELYVLGRMGDSVKVHGRAVYMEDLEAEISAIPGMAKRSVATVAGLGPQGPVVCAVVEASEGPWVRQVADALQRATAGAYAVRVFAARRFTILRTSSGKPRRRPMWRALIEQRLEPALALEVAAGGQNGTRPAPAVAPQAVPRYAQG